MYFRFLTDLGGMAWWLFVKLGKTELDSELAEDKLTRNILVVIACVIIGVFISVNFFD